LAIDAMVEGGSYPTALNAANEVAVDAFLNRTIGYLQIASVTKAVLNSWQSGEPESLLAVKEADAEARRIAELEIVRLGKSF